MKKNFLAVLFALSVLVMSTTAFAQDVTVKLNGASLSFDVKPFIEEDRTLVPVRGIFESVGASVNWDDETRTVMVNFEKDGKATFVVLQIDNERAFVNGEEKVLDVPARIVNNRTFVPLRFMMEAMGSSVAWDQSTYTVSITK